MNYERGVEKHHIIRGSDTECEYQKLEGCALLLGVVRYCVSSSGVNGADINNC